MIGLFRRGGPAQFVMGGVVVLIMAAFILEFRSWGRSDGPQGKLQRECVVRVYGDCVDPKEFNAAYGLIAANQVTAAQSRQMGLRADVIDGLVERQLLLRAARDLGVSASEASVDEELLEGRARASLPAGKLTLLAYQLSGRFDPDAMRLLTEESARLLPVKSAATKEFDMKVYERVVRNVTNRSAKEFKAMQQRELVAQRMRQLVQARVRVSDSEAWLAFEDQKSKAVARTVRVQRDWFAKWALEGDEAGATKWIAENAAQVDEAWKTAQAGWTKSCPHVHEILLPFTPGLGDDDKKALTQKLTDARARIEAGGSFEIEARTLGEGASAGLSGDVGCLSAAYGEGSTELLAAIEKLEPGKLSPVVTTPRGVHLVRLDERVAEADTQTKGRAFVARSLFARFRSDELARKFAESLIAKVRAGAKLEDAAKELMAAAVRPIPGAKADAEHPALSAEDRPRVEVSAPFNSAGAPVEDAAPSESVAALVFALAQPDEVVARPIATRSGVAVVQLKEKQSASRADFEKEKATFVRGILVAKQHEALVAYVTRLRNAAKDQIQIEARFAEEPKSANDDE